MILVPFQRPTDGRRRKFVYAVGSVNRNRYPKVERYLPYSLLTLFRSDTSVYSFTLVKGSNDLVSWRFTHRICSFYITECQGPRFSGFSFVTVPTKTNSRHYLLDNVRRDIEDPQTTVRNPKQPNIFVVGGETEVVVQKEGYTHRDRFKRENYSCGQYDLRNIFPDRLGSPEQN